MLALNADTALEPGCVGRSPRRSRPMRSRRRAAADPPARGGRDRARVEHGPPLQPRQGAEHRRARASRKAPGRRSRRPGWRGGRSSASAAPPACCGGSCFDALGGYDERYFAFYEDVDLNVRARIAGWRFAYVPEAVVWHVGNASWSAGFERPARGTPGSSPAIASPPRPSSCRRRRCRGSPRSRPGRWRGRRGSGGSWATLSGKLAALTLAAGAAARAPPPAPRR